MPVFFTGLLEISHPTVNYRVWLGQAVRWLEKLAQKDDAAQSFDFVEDLAAWRELDKEISRTLGPGSTLQYFLQELPKEPPFKEQNVVLTTIHDSKGKEFDFVYLVGMAEDILPSFQSKKKGLESPEMEEERRNCFVAITRTQESLTLTRADIYRGFKKQPSRFLAEMGLKQDAG